MFEAAIQELLAIVTATLPTLGVSSTSLVTQIISSLTSLLPTILTLGGDVIAQVQSIISGLQSGSTPLTAGQLSTLQTMSAQCDAAFDAAAKDDGLTPPADDDVTTAATPSTTS